MGKGKALFLFLLFLGLPFYPVEAQEAEAGPAGPGSAEGSPPEDSPPEYEPVQDRIEELQKTGGQKHFVERLKGLLSDERPFASWYLFLLDDVFTRGEGCEFLRGRTPDQMIEALDMLEREIEVFLMKKEEGLNG
jgi:hypothetical protein